MLHEEITFVLMMMQHFYMADRAFHIGDVGAYLSIILTVTISPLGTLRAGAGFGSMRYDESDDILELFSVNGLLDTSKIVLYDQNALPSIRRQTTSSTIRGLPLHKRVEHPWSH